MSAEQAFSIANLSAAAGWLLLIAIGRRRWVHTVVTGGVLPVLLSVLYVVLLVTQLGRIQGGFGSLAGVQALFSNEWVLLAGWVHYLAFDLLIGSWEARDAQKHGISHLAVVPCLILTFLFGPAGFLLYLVVRTALRTFGTVTS
jgi:hypothetical protein